MEEDIVLPMAVLEVSKSMLVDEHLALMPSSPDAVYCNVRFKFPESLSRLSLSDVRPGASLSQRAVYLFSLCLSFINSSS